MLPIAPLETVALGREAKARGQQLGIGAVALLALAEGIDIEAAAPRAAKQVQDMLGLVRRMSLEPFAEEVGDLQRQTQQHIASGARARFGGRREDRLELH